MNTSNEMIDHIELLGEALSGHPVSPALAERLNVAIDLLSGSRSPEFRTVGAPVYVTDLGVRRFADPARFYEAHLRSTSVPSIDRDAIGSALHRAELASLEGVIDAAILFFGAYDQVGSAILGRLPEIRKSRDYGLLIVAGTVLAACGVKDDLDCYDAAEECSADEGQAYGAAHRAAAFEIKRLGDLDSGVLRLRRAADAYIGAVRTDDPSRLSNSALYYNLRALAEARGGEPRARQSIEAAGERVDEAIANSEPGQSDLRSRAGRYKSQIAQNQAQLALVSGDTVSAVEILEENLEFAKKSAYDYLAEARVQAAYANYRAGNWVRSITLGCEAFFGEHIIGAVSAIEFARNIVFASLSKSGRADVADRAFQNRREDTLGLKGLPLDVLFRSQD